MNAIAARLASQYPEDRAWDSTTVVPLHDVVTGPVRAVCSYCSGPSASCC